MVEPSPELVEDLKVVQRTKRDWRAAVAKVGECQKAMNEAQQQEREAHEDYQNAMRQLEKNA